MAYQFGVLQQFAGINIVFIYGVQIVASVYPSIKYIIPFVVSFEVAAFGLFFPFLAKRLGRRTILLCGCIVNMIGTLLMGVGFSIINKNFQAAKMLVLLGMFIFMANYSLTVGSVTFILIS